MEFLRGSPSIQDRARVRLCLVGGGTYVDDSSDSSDEADGGSSLSLYIGDTVDALNVYREVSCRGTCTEKDKVGLTRLSRKCLPDDYRT